MSRAESLLGERRGGRRVAPPARRNNQKPTIVITHAVGIGNGGNVRCLACGWQIRLIRRSGISDWFSLRQCKCAVVRTGAAMTPESSGQWARLLIHPGAYVRLVAPRHQGKKGGVGHGPR